MKTCFATILALCSLAVSASAQGVFIMDSSANIGNGSGPLATTDGLVWVPGTGGIPVLDTFEDINVGVLWGTSSTSVTTPMNLDPLGLNTGAAAGSGNWIASQATGTSDITGYAEGALLDPQGNSYVVPGAAAGTTIWLVVQGWLGNSPTYAGAGIRGETTPFAITLVANTDPLEPDVHGMSALVLEPEPSLPALSALGAVAFALFRRRK